MQGIVCDGCGEGLLIDSNVRYIVKIEAYAAYDPLELTRDDLERATPEAYQRLIEELEASDPREVERQVYVQFEYDLCPVCHRRYLENPLGAAAGRRDEEEGESSTEARG